MKKMSEEILLPYIFADTGEAPPKSIRMTPESINKKLQKAPRTKKELLRVLSRAGIAPKDLIPDKEFSYLHNTNKIHYTEDLIKDPRGSLSSLFHEKGHGVGPKGIKGEIKAWEYTLNKLNKPNLGPRDSVSLGTHLIMDKIYTGKSPATFRESASSVVNAIENMDNPAREITDAMKSQEKRLQKVKAKNRLLRNTPKAKQKYARSMAKEIYKEVKRTGLKPAPAKEIESFFLNEIYKLEKSGVPSRTTMNTKRLLPKKTMLSKLLKTLKKIK